MKFKQGGFNLIFIALGTALTILALLFHRPSAYQPVHTKSSNQVSTYLTNELLPQIYNGSQLSEPFDVVVTQKGINEIAARYAQLQNSAAGFLLPMFVFSPGKVITMGTVKWAGLKFVVTVAAAPKINKAGFLSLRLTKVKIGALPVTPFARWAARRAYQEQLASDEVDAHDAAGVIIRMLLNEEGAEPAFEVDGEKVRLEKITLEKEKLTVKLAPAAETEGKNL